MFVIMSTQKTKRGGGRPTKYIPDYCRQAVELISKHGVTIEALAGIWGVNKTSIYEWSKKHPEFSNALQEGRDLWHCAEVEKSLYQRAIGYHYTERTREYEITPMGDEYVKVPVAIKEKRKSVAPDVRAQQFYLRSRNPKRWPNLNKQDQDKTPAVTINANFGKKPKNGD